ncbi:MAG: hypothetical protein PWP07_1555, partial [Epulopiscium sp.]|nr:hypothetical protein [Candidatus Epulonipiscium sp.]
GLMLIEPSLTTDLIGIVIIVFIIFIQYVLKGKDKSVESV